MEKRIMYSPQKDSPTTFITGDLTATDQMVTVGNASILPAIVPFPLTLGIDKTVTETVIVTEIGDGNNQLTIERLPGALAWVNGTRCARVFNAADLEALQENVSDVIDMANGFEDIILETQTSVEEVKVTVGDQNGGLVKDLTDEIVRAKAAEEAEVTRAKAAEAALQAAKVDRTDLPQVITDWQSTNSPTEMLVTITRFNANTKETTTYTRTISIVDGTNVGLMTPEAYNEITTLRSDVLALQQQGGRYIGVSFATKSDLDNYTPPSTVNNGDFTYVLDDNEHSDATTRYIYDGSKFNFAYVINYDPVDIATNTVAGIVKGSTVDGRIFVETNGEMSVIGWDAINNRVTAAETDVSDALSIASEADTTANTALQQAQNLDTSKQNKSVTQVIDVDGMGGWSGSGPYTKTMSISGVTATSVIYVAPVPNDDNINNVMLMQLYASGQGAGTLSFTAASLLTDPTEVALNLVINN